MFPNLTSLSYAEECYYARHDIAYNTTLCGVLSGAIPPAPYMLNLTRPLKAMYVNYVQTEPLDKWAMVNCLLQVPDEKSSKDREEICKFHLGLRNSTEFGQIFSAMNTTKRENQTNDYLRELIKFNDTINQCQAQVIKNETCTFLDLEEKLEHCFYFHRFDRYQPCEGLSWSATNGTEPLDTAPFDLPSLLRFRVWRRFADEQRHQIQQTINLGNPKLGLVLYCLHSPDHWIAAASIQDRCHEVVKKPSKKATTPITNKEMIIIQKMYQQKQRDELRYDCFSQYHKEEKLAKCKWISWQP